MEEKERYVFKESTAYELLHILDTKTNEKMRGFPYIVKILNQQDNRIKALEEDNQQFKQKAIVPKCLLGTTLYMIPTKFNGLKTIKDYTLLSISLSSIGIRYELSINKKERGIESYYYASEDMFGESIFVTREEAEQKFNKTGGTLWKK